MYYEKRGNGRDMQQLRPGSKLNNRYQIRRFLGQGGFAFTYEAIQQSIARRVCIKELFITGKMERNTEQTDEVTLSVAADAEAMEHCKRAFLEEGHLLGAISCDSIVRVIDSFEENHTCYIVLEYLEGITLKEYVREKGRIPCEKLFSMAEPLLKNLSVLHGMQLIHRDIAPDNIMVVPANGKKGQEQTEALKLFDFGTARETGRSEYTCVLKDGYSPIEQIAGEENQGPATDIYAFCATMWYCLTSETPEGAYSRLLEDDLKKPSELGVRIDPAMETVLMKGLAVQPSDRYQSVEELLAAAESVRPKSVETASAVPERKSHKKQILCGLVLAAVLAIVAGLFWYKNHSRTVYDPETMYKVTLTPDDTFTVAGFNASIDSLKERLNVFSEKSGFYSLTEDKGRITLLLNKKDFAENTAINEVSDGVSMDYAAIPEYVLRAYLVRAMDLELENTETGEHMALKQTEDFTVQKKEGTMPAEEAEANAEESGTYLDVQFSAAFAEKNAALLKHWGTSYRLCQDVDSVPLLSPVTTWPKKDGTGFYLMDTDDGAYTDLLIHDLTHEALEHGFAFSIEEQVDWQEQQEITGKRQVSQKALQKENDAGLQCFVYGFMTQGELQDCYQSLQARLDTLQIPYALGQMDALSAALDSCDAAVYTFVALQTERALQYTDLLDLVFNSRYFYLTQGDAEPVQLYGTEIRTDGQGMTVTSQAAKERLQENGQPIYLSCTDDAGNAQTLLLRTQDMAEDGTLRFVQFAKGTGITEENSRVLQLIDACIKNRLPVDLRPYAVKTDGENVQEEQTTGLFVEESTE